MSKMGELKKEKVIKDGGSCLKERHGIKKNLFYMASQGRIDLLMTRKSMLTVKRPFKLAGKKNLVIRTPCWKLKPNKFK